MNFKLRKAWCACIPFLLSACATTVDGPKFEGVSVTIPQDVSREDIIRLATEVRPSYRQLDYQQREMLGFIHIGMNTFTGAEWGTGKEDPVIFNPSCLDAEEWVKTFKDAGISGVILVAKHHDGFCVWPSKYTDHTVANSPWRDGKGDLVREVADACHKYDMKLCIYLSPWDMHASTYGTEEYNDYYIHQLEELLTNYGPVYLLWFDGAGTDSRTSGKDMPFDWERIFRRARELQPDILLSGNAPDIRWVGNEAGHGRETEWSVQGVDGDAGGFGSQRGFDASAKNLASIDDLITKKTLVWYPSRGGLPLRKGWFYNAHDDYTTKSLNYLVDSYFSTIGQNSNLLPNLSPDTLGLIPERDAKRLIDFGNIIKEMKKVDYAKGAKVIPVKGWEGTPDSRLIVDDDPFTSWHTIDGIKTAEAEIVLTQPATINVIKLQENIRDYGQRVECFAVDAQIDGIWKEVGQSTTIGFRKMLRLSEPVTTDRFRVRFLDARVSVSWSNLSLYYLADLPEEINDIPIQNSLPKTDWKVSLTGLSGNATQKLTDNNPQTCWEGKLSGKEGEIVIKLPQPQKIGALTYLPVNDKEAGHIDYYAVFVSQDGKNWGNPIAQGRFGNIVNNPVEQLITFQKWTVSYIKLVVKKSTIADGRLKIAELSLYQ